MIALVLAAGFGTRFRPATLTTPKPLLPFLGRPILFHLFDHLIGSCRVDAFVLNAHHLGQVLEARVGTSYEGRPVRYSHEDPILGTAGAIRRAHELGLLGSGPFLVANGDVYTSLPLAPLLANGLAEGLDSALAVIPNERPDVDTPLWAGADGRLVGLGDRPADAASGPWLFTGLSLASPRLVDRIPPGVSELARDVLRPSTERRDGAFALVPYRVPSDGLWFDLGSPGRLSSAEDAVMRSRSERLSSAS